MDAVFSQPGFHNILPASASSFDGVRAQVDKLMRQLSGKNGRVVAEIIGEAQGDPEALKNLVENFFRTATTRWPAIWNRKRLGRISGRSRYRSRD